MNEDDDGPRMPYLTEGPSSDWCRAQELRCEIDPVTGLCIHCGEAEKEKRSWT